MAQQDDGIGHKLLSFLPISRHATFRIKLTIHDITNIPFQSGSFALQWKFKNARSNSGHQSRPATPTTNGLRRGTQDSESEAPRSSLDEGNRRFTSNEKGKSRTSVGGDSSPGTTPANGLTPASAAMVNGTKHGYYLSPSPSGEPNGVTPTSKPPPPLSPLPVVRIDDAHKGGTEYVALKDHTVRWDHTVEVVVHFKIKRETLELQPCELKLILLQNFPDNPNPDANSRFGVLYLNLAEYADRGPVTRRYLLHESKTNALLKLTIESTYMGGDKKYNVPNLQKGQPVAGVAGVLSNDNFLPFLNLPDRSSSATATANASRASTPTSVSTMDLLTRPSLPHQRTSFGSARALQRFIVDQSQHSAESVIEALFNPIPTTSTTPSPFTYRTNEIRPTSASTEPGFRAARPSTATTITTTTTNSASMDESSRDDSHDEASLDHSAEFGMAGSESLAASQVGTPDASGSLRGGWFRRRVISQTRPSTAPTSYKSLSSRGVAVPPENVRVPLPPHHPSEVSTPSSEWTDVASYPTTPAIY